MFGGKVTGKLTGKPSFITEQLSVLREGFLELAWPARCVGCDLPGTLLCADCEGSLPLIDVATACPSCGAPYGVVVCTECGAGKAGLV
ncbi:MAG: hypothetical protein HGA54_07520, partial [Actinobacteria bacterium]|nr:hypothetical protein [Actinomycetota bacterium]